MENDLFLSDVSMPISIINNSKESIYLAEYNIYENKYLKKFRFINNSRRNEKTYFNKPSCRSI